ncbi:hypothetical protein [Dolosigranulum savutiense]|mgnify:CR=1 FL=1|uniref:Uncharacterized protein n=1 Tax=Dolosigranulum savutiense TaxID=3110288 RepID=A0AB74TUT2_9LACT
MAGIVRHERITVNSQEEFEQLQKRLSQPNRSVDIRGNLDRGKPKGVRIVRGLPKEKRQHDKEI